MAETKKKTSDKKNAASVKAGGSKSGGTKPRSKANAAVEQKKAERLIPLNYWFAVISAAVFLVLLVVVIKPEGKLPLLIQKMVLGLIGKIGFYMAIPASLYLFVILAFQTKTKIKMRSFCTLGFVFVCGISMQLLVAEQTFAGVFPFITGMWKGGVDGSTAGLICGSVGILLRIALGEFISFVVLILVAVLTLLGSMQITIPGLIRAIENRPREEPEEFDEEEESSYEPAALLVNHIATKRIEQKRRQKQRSLDERYEVEYYDQKVIPPTVESQAAAGSLVTVTVPEKPKSAITRKLNDFMSQIEGDINAPVAAAGYAGDTTEEAVPQTKEPAHKVTPVKSVKKVEPETGMPVFVPTKDGKDEENSEQKSTEKGTAQETAAAAVQVAVEIASAQTDAQKPYCFPPISLLKIPPRSAVNGTEEMKENSRRLNETLESFRIDAHIINVTRGPSVTRYEVELDKGVRLSKLTTCADDIALSLGASGVRIAAVPGKISVVGIEVPNQVVTTVSLREVIDSPEFAKSKGKSTFAVGKDIGGTCIVGNIAKMPHLLIAGTTGSGKSVCMNSIIISLLYKSSPEDVKLIMVDPKMVELANYNGIPHLMIPVVTDPQKAAGALQWAVTEMMRRYKTMSDAGVRDLESYNSIVEAEGGEKVPQLIVIIDELADLMMVAAKEVEDSICRIAQMGRASGVHLVIATQRPSADVITGLMKANIPSRIAFSVSSGMESRIILDTQGAEKLVGKGDMLFAPIGCGKPLRVQGCFVTDREVEEVAAYVKDNYAASYDQSVLDDIEKKALQNGKKSSGVAAEPEPNTDELEGDELLPQAVDVVLETGQASVSMLQRRLKLGYARAARIVDEMEEKGIVGPFQGSKPRTILITKEQWATMQSGTVQMTMDDLDNAPVPEDLPF